MPEGEKNGNRSQVQRYTKETRLVIPSMQRALVRLQKEVPWGQLLRNPHFLAFGSGLLIILLFGRIERIPISRRFHLVLSCKTLERKLGEWQLNNEKEKYQGKILPPNSPQSIRVRRILKEIIQGMHSGLRLEKDCSVRVHECKNLAKLTPSGRRRKAKPSDEELSRGRGLVYHKPVERIQKKMRKYGWRYATKHLDGLNWEVMVVDSYICNAYYIPDGKIVIFTGLLKKLKSDAEVAVVVGHEVGHGVAQHIAEHLLIGVIGLMWIFVLVIIWPDNAREYHPIKFLLSFISRKREMEADYIGMMLMAAARYDPRLAPEVELKIDDRDHHDLLSTHPCGHKRATKLENAEVMDKAMAIYKDVTSGLGVKSFV